MDDKLRFTICITDSQRLEKQTPVIRNSQGIEKEEEQTSAKANFNGYQSKRSD